MEGFISPWWLVEWLAVSMMVVAGLICIPIREEVA
jgi:ABC-type Co2+ transport system permease subunit